MSKLLRTVQGEPGTFIFWCPGCECGHQVWTQQSDKAIHAVWKFNGDFEKPTFSPSLLIDASRPERRCHLFITNGNIQYLDDCYHGLKGRTVPMEKF